MITLAQCRGCHDDFYNGPRGHNGRCWNADSGEVVTRYRTGINTRPAERHAFTEVTVPSCYRCPGQVFCEALPGFVKPEDVVRRRAAS